MLSNNQNLLPLSTIIRLATEQGINFGTGKGNLVLEIVDKVEQQTNVKITLNKTTSRQGEYAKMIASIDKAKKVLGWTPERTIADSIKSLSLWYKNHPKGWEK